MLYVGGVVLRDAGGFPRLGDRDRRLWSACRSERGGAPGRGAGPAHQPSRRAEPVRQGELQRLAQTPFQAISAQSGLALLIGGYTAHRGFKALLAGLSFIHDEDAPRGFVGFNIMALLCCYAAFAMLAFFSAIFFYFRFVAAALRAQAAGEFPGSTANGLGQLRPDRGQ